MEQLLIVCINNNCMIQKYFIIRIDRNNIQVFYLYWEVHKILFVQFLSYSSWKCNHIMVNKCFCWLICHCTINWTLNTMQWRTIHINEIPHVKCVEPWCCPHLILFWILFYYSGFYYTPIIFKKSQGKYQMLFLSTKLINNA